MWPPYEAYKPVSVEWLDEVPQHWASKRLKYAASLNDEALPESTDPTYEFFYVDIGNVEAVNGIAGTERVVFEDAPSRARRIARPGDTIVSTVRTYLRAIAPVRDVDGELVVSTGFAVVRPRGVEHAYLSYALRESRFVEAIVSRSFGVSYPAINARDVASIEVSLPPPDEQRAIARFLDVETGKLDKLVAKKRTLIERLQEERASLIARTVTRGLRYAATCAADPTAPSVMKATGIDWMPEVPAHWEVKPLMRLVWPDRPINYGVLMPGPSLPEGIPLVEAGDIMAGPIVPDELRRTAPEIEEPFARSRLRPGDVVVAIRGSIGAAEIVPDGMEGANVTRDAARVSPSPEMNPTLLAYILGSQPLRSYYDSLSRGTAVQGINIFDLKRAPIPVPPPAEQTAIVQHLAASISRLDSVVSRCLTVIDRLQEYRAALITAAITGKIDVRGAAS